MSSPPPVRPRSAPQQPRRRSRARTVVPLVIAAWAVLEIWLLVVVAEATSGLAVLMFLLAGFLLGAAAVKRAGRSAWRNLTASVQQASQASQASQTSARGEEGPQGAGAAQPVQPAGGGRTGLHMLGGLLLMIPGFVSDGVALLLLFPPTRKLIGHLGERAAARALAQRPAGPAEPGSFGDFFQQARDAGDQARIHRPDGKVIPGEVIPPDDNPPKH